jgi:hypothetical protein
MDVQDDIMNFSCFAEIFFLFLRKIESWELFLCVFVVLFLIKQVLSSHTDKIRMQVMYAYIIRRVIHFSFFFYLLLLLPLMELIDEHTLSLACSCSVSVLNSHLDNAITGATDLDGATVVGQANQVASTQSKLR